MSVLDLDFYKLTMLQFIWKHYADIPVTFRLHSRKQDLGGIVNPGELHRQVNEYRAHHLTMEEFECLRDLDIFEESFLRDLDNLFATINGQSGMLLPQVISQDEVLVFGNWFEASLWETVILSMVSENYSLEHVEQPSLFRQFKDIAAIAKSGAWWADFGTRRRWSQETHELLVSALEEESKADTHFIGTSNVDFAFRYGLRPIGTYAHELEMVLRPHFSSEFDTTRDVLTKWQEMYERRYRIALTDTYTTPKFFEDHGEFLLENDWRGVRLDSGNPIEMGQHVDNWLSIHRPGHLDLFDVVFSDKLNAKRIIALQHGFGQNNGHPATFIHPVFGWGTGLTNPNSDLSLVMKAVESNGVQTYKTTDDEEKSIR